MLRVFDVTARGSGLAEAVREGTSGSQADGRTQLMDFAWSEQQRELLDAVGRFGSQQLNYNVIENDRDGVFNHDAWKKCGSFGIQGLLVRAEYGGLGMDPLTTVAALERLGYACKDNGLLFSINAHMWTAITPLVYNGSEAQKKKYLPGLCDGTLCGYGGGLWRKKWLLDHERRWKARD